MISRDLVTRSSGFLSSGHGLQLRDQLLDVRWVIRSATDGRIWSSRLRRHSGSTPWCAPSGSLPGSALLSPARLWILNFHGINTAVLWLSGRTALLLTLFRSLRGDCDGAESSVPDVRVRAAGDGSKEEGVLLPIVLLSIVVLHPSRHNAADTRPRCDLQCRSGGGLGRVRRRSGCNLMR
jgi:hypothetical protein